MASSDLLGDIIGKQPAAVHMGTWYAGDLLDAGDWPISRTASLAGMAMFSMWKSETISGQTNNFAWSEASRADGSVIFDGIGGYSINIQVHDLGQHTCGTSSPCTSGIQANTEDFLPNAIGTLAWSASGNSGNPHFEQSNLSRNGNTIEYSSINGSLFGKASHIEAGAELIWSKQNAENYLQAIGTVILSE